jgi:hypothetical protein
MTEVLARAEVERGQAALSAAATNGRHPIPRAVRQFLNASYCDSAKRWRALIRLRRIGRQFAALDTLLQFGFDLYT